MEWNPNFFLVSYNFRKLPNRTEPRNETENGFVPAALTPPHFAHRRHHHQPQTSRRLHRHVDLLLDRPRNILPFPSPEVPQPDQALLQLRPWPPQPRLGQPTRPLPPIRLVSSPLLPLLRFPARSLTNPLLSSLEGIVDAPLYDSMFRSLPPSEPVSCSSILTFFYDSLALSAWKIAGYSTWSLRVNPSSGNRHPTEAYVVSSAIRDLYGSSSFIAHYAPKEHAIEVRAEIPSGFLREFFPEDCLKE